VPNEDNYFESDEEDVVHDAFLMIASSETDYGDIEDVLIGETIYDEHTIEFWKDELGE
jgi:hypothetical protein